MLGQGERHGGRADVAVGRQGERELGLGSTPSALAMARMCTTEVWWATKQSASAQWKSALGVAPGRDGQLETRLEQPLGVGPHEVQVADAQVVVLGAGPADPADDPVSLVDADRTRPSTIAADPEPRVRVANCARRSSAVAVGAASRFERRLLGVARPFAVHQQRVVGLAGVDHGAGELDRR